MMVNKVFEWPNRYEAKRGHRKNTQEKGPGCFMIKTQPGVNLGEGWTVGVPEWATGETFKDLPANLLSPTTLAIESALKANNHTILVIAQATTYQIVKVPFDPKKECALLFEAVKLE